MEAFEQEAMPLATDKPKLRVHNVDDPRVSLLRSRHAFLQRRFFLGGWIGLLVTRSLSMSSSNTTVACLLNPSPDAVTVCAQEKVGMFQPLTESEAVGVSAVELKPTAAERKGAIEEVE